MAFIEQASNFLDNNRKVRCPYKKFVNISFEGTDILRNGFYKFYTQQIFHDKKFDDVVNEEDDIAENAKANEIVNVLKELS